MEPQGYPQVVILIVLLVGGGLAFVRPYAAFLFAIFLLTAGHVTMFNQTRLSALGPYLNLNDACVLVAMVAFFFDKMAGKERVRMPQIVPLMFFVVTLGAVQSFWKLGWTYDTMRATRWALDIPMALFLGANMVTSGDRARKLVGILLAGALLAAIQHVAFVANIWRTRSLTMETYENMRTIGFWGGCLAPAFLLTTVVWKLPSGLIKRVLWLAAGGLFVTTIFLNQTRSIWVGLTLTVPVLAVLFKKRHYMASLAKFGALGLAAVIVLAFACQRLLPGINVASLFTDRMELLANSRSAKVHMGTRERALGVEMSQWWDGTLLFGRGLYFFQDIENSDDPAYKIAFGHLGYVTYLSQLGLIGVAVYGFCLPWGVIRRSRFLYFHSSQPAVQYMALLAASSVLCLSFIFIMSSHFLALGYFAPGVLYGGLSALVSTTSTAEDWDVENSTGVLTCA